LLKDAVHYNMSKIIDAAIDVLAKNFDLLPLEEHLSFLPYSILLKLVSHSNLIVEDEFRLFVIILNYVTACNGLDASVSRQASTNSLQEHLTNDQISSLFKHVAFHNLSVEQLEKASSSPWVPQSVLIQGLVNSLKQVHGLPLKTIDR
jgi:hypothetical protein